MTLRIIAASATTVVAAVAVPATKASDLGLRPSPANLDIRYGTAVLESDPQARVLALAVRFPVGTAQDPIGGEGTAFLFGRLLEGQGNRGMAQYGASMEVDVGAEEILVSLVAAPTQWRDAVSELEDVLYRRPLSIPDLESARTELLRVLTFEAGAPVRTFERERDVFLLGATNPAARPPQGTGPTVETITDSDLEAYRSTNLRREQALVAATGPVEAEELSTLLGVPVRTLSSESPPASGSPPTPRPAPTGADSLVGAGAAPAGVRTGRTATDSLPPAPVLRLYRTSSPALEVPAEPIGAPAWTTGDRMLLDRELTSTWISVSFPFPRGTPRMLLEFLAHLITEDLTPSPPDPGLFEAQATPIEIRGAPVLVVTASVDPRATSRWEDRLNGALRELAEAPPAGAFFELTRRRFRSAVLLEQAVPENRARWLARQVARGEDVTIDPESAIWALQRPAVGVAAAAAGPPRTILFGPRDMMDR